MTQIFNIELAQQLIESNNQFPVDFDLGWQWLEYSKKANAKAALIENFEEGIDFIFKDELRTLAVPRPAEKILLTIDCFKSWGMMCGTQKGKEVRRYFLECERIAKGAIQQPKELSRLEILKLAIASEEANLLLKAKIVSDEPKVNFAEAVEGSETDLAFNEYAKVINWGRNRMMSKLRNLGILMENSTLPYQRFIDAGYFTVSETVGADNVIRPFALVTGKGQLWLSRKLNVSIALTKSEGFTQTTLF